MADTNCQGLARASVQAFCDCMRQLPSAVIEAKLAVKPAMLQFWRRHWQSPFYWLDTMLWILAREAVTELAPEMRAERNRIGPVR